MSNQKTYKTKQKLEIVEYLKTVQDCHINVQQIFNYLNSINKPVGVTTIYRHLENLVAEGVVKKYLFDNNCAACFQYVSKCSQKVHFHFKCNKCFKLIHFECEELINLHNHLLNSHNLNIDLSKTTYYGTCKSCS